MPKCKTPFGERYATVGPEGQGSHRDDTSAALAANRVILKQIETAADKAATDPAYAAAQGIAPMAPTPLFDQLTGERLAMLGPTRADWLRGAVVALRPAGTRYAVVEEFGGEARLLLLPADGR